VWILLLLILLFPANSLQMSDFVTKMALRFLVRALRSFVGFSTLKPLDVVVIPVVVVLLLMLMT
jgi:hypothetical protein